MAAPPSPPPSLNVGVLPQPKDASFLNGDLRGEVFAGSVEVTAAGVVLPNNPCRYVMLCNWNTNTAPALNYSALSFDGLYENSGLEFLYGFNGAYVAQLFPSQNSGLLPVKNTNLICVRTRPGQTRTLFYAWFY
jgi:hypothetical protein